MGIPSIMFTPLFALARTTGWIAQWKEMIETDSKISRPRQLYLGEKERKIKEQEDAIAAEKAKKEAEKLAKAPIKKQLNIWVESFALPETLIENETANDIKAKFASFKEWSTKQVELI